MERKALIDIGLRYGALLILIFAILLPSLTQISSYRRKINKVTDEIRSARATIGIADKWIEVLPPLEDEITVLNSRLFQKEDLVAMLKHISAIAEASNLRLTASRPLPEALLSLALDSSVLPKELRQLAGSSIVSSNRHDAYLSEMEFSGTFHALGNFFSALRYGDKLILPYYLLIQPGEDYAHHRIKVKFAAYYQVPEKVIPEKKSKKKKTKSK